VIVRRSPSPLQLGELDQQCLATARKLDRQPLLHKPRPLECLAGRSRGGLRKGLSERRTSARDLEQLIEAALAG
jgi:hypothetical protein